jgi:hypothetical protein
MESTESDNLTIRGSRFGGLAGRRSRRVIARSWNGNTSETVSSKSRHSLLEIAVSLSETVDRLPM